MFQQNINNTTTGNKKDRLRMLFGSMAAVCAYVAVQHFFFKGPSFDKALVASANEMNKVCPMMLDKYTRLDNTIALPGNSFQYNYTLVSVEKSQGMTDTVKKYIAPGIINGIKTSPDLKLFRDHKATMVYCYRDKNGELIYKLSVTPNMYE
jgi:hypothetical protein